MKTIIFELAVCLLGIVMFAGIATQAVSASSTSAKVICVSPAPAISSSPAILEMVTFVKGEAIAQCSATLIAEDTILTARHCLPEPGAVAKVEGVTVLTTLPAGDGYYYLMDEAVGPDAVLLRLDIPLWGHPVARLGATPPPGSHVRVEGVHTLGPWVPVRAVGPDSLYEKETRRQGDVISVDGEQAVHGDSGGAIFNLKGEVVGVVSAGRGGSGGVSYFSTIK